jgi:hypothetical protein
LSDDTRYELFSIDTERMYMKKIVIVALSLIVIAAAVYAICANSNLQTITGRCLVTTNGIYIIVDKNGSPVVMDNQSGNESLFDGLNSGDEIRITCDMIQTSYPGKTGVIKCKLIAKGGFNDIPEKTLSELHELGWGFEGER